MYIYTRTTWGCKGGVKIVVDIQFSGYPLHVALWVLKREDKQRPANV